MKPYDPGPCTRVGWPSGEWDDEPDLEEWTDPSTRYECCAMRNPMTGSLMGYVGVPRDHAAFGEPYQDIDVSVHGGLSYGAKRRGLMWFGFDCAHAGDLVPTMQMDSLLKDLEEAFEKLAGHKNIYRNWAYVRNECRLLAAQLASQATSGPSGPDATPRDKKH
jgi:hypothetical protein